MAKKQGGRGGPIYWAIMTAKYNGRGWQGCAMKEGGGEFQESY